MIEKLIAELNWGTITALAVALGTLIKLLGDRAATKRASIRAASKSVAEEWEAFCAKQQARIDQLVAQMGHYESRIAALETELEQTRIERDTERGQRQALERKVADLEREIDALRKQANRVRP